jgi:outer membrane lipoprotein-sorting protein
MNLPVDDNDLESALRTALGGQREISFDQWRTRHGDALAQLGRRPPSFLSTRRTQIMRWSTAALATVFATAGLWAFLRGGGAEQVFAQALDRAANAHTFSADVTMTYAVDDRQERTQQRVMFKEPHLERREILMEGRVQQVTITDYGNRRRMTLDPANKIARPADLNNSFEIDPETGGVNLTQLDTSLRERLLSMHSDAVEDLGEVELSGRTVRLMQSSEEDRVVKVWADPQADVPVQISIELPDQEIVYSSIKIDEELPEDRFSFEPPDGYQVMSQSMPTPQVGRVFAKTKYLLLKCWEYASEHDNEFPGQLSDLDVDGDILRNLLTIEEGGRFEYVQPQLDGDMSRKIVLYESHDVWPQQGVVVGFADGHCEFIQEEDRFKQLLNNRTGK